MVGALSEASRNRAAVELLSYGLEFTALVAGNDLMAYGDMTAFRQAGLRIRQEFPVPGLDDIDMGEYTAPALTTVRPPLALVAAVAVDILAERSAHAVPAPIRIPVELVVRSSTTRPGAARSPEDGQRHSTLAANDGRVKSAAAL